MSKIEAVVRREPYEVEARLAELQLGPVVRLLRVRSIAIAAGADATSFHPANAAGTLAYQHGTFALRKEYVSTGKEHASKDWRIDRQHGVEAISNESLKVRVAFSNVDIACDDDQKPKPRSRKGAGAERVCQGNLFDYLPEYSPLQHEGWLTFYLMVDPRGAAELTRPVVEHSTFTAWPERNYLSNGDDLDLEGKRLPLDDNDTADDFDPEVVRK
jgi:hypothetical protein